jgi:hypothetical protein
MSEYNSKTDTRTEVELESAINRVVWTRGAGCRGGKAGLDIDTQFVGNNSNATIDITDATGKKYETIKRMLSGNTVRLQITVPEKAKDELYAEVKLTKHGLSKKSNCLYVYPKIPIKNLKWDKKEARRGDVLKLTADVDNVSDGTEAEIQIWEHDTDGAHDFITKFPAIVKDKKIEAEWEYEYHEDTDDIPTEEETEKGYNPPEYFFRVIIAGVSEDSDLLEFKDWIEINLTNQIGKPIPDEEYILHLPDGTERKGQLDDQGHAIERDVPPGKYTVEFPNL